MEVFHNILEQGGGRMARTIGAEHIDRERMPGLAAMIRRAGLCYLLDDDANRGMTLLLDYGDGRGEMVQAQASYTYRGKFHKERLATIPLSWAAMDALEDIFPPKQPDNLGRPRALDEQGEETARRLRAEGYSIREIAGKMGVSVGTVHRTLHREKR